MNAENKSIVRQRIGGNIISLALINGVGLLTPLLLIPYLLRIIGNEGYGIYIFSWTFINYFIIIVNYGYDYFATREIATHKTDSDFIARFFFEVSFSRVLLAVLSLLIVFACVFFIPEFNSHKLFILLGIGVFIGQSIHPTWIFQGMEEMGFLTAITLITRLVPIVLVFLFVKGPEQAHLVMLFQSIGYIIGGVVSSILAIRRYHLHFIVPSFYEMLKQLKASWILFFTTVGITLYRETNVIILGFVTGNYILVGYYSIADKFIRLFQMTITPIVQALFPYFGKKFNETSTGYSSLSKISILLTIYLLILCACILLFANFMVDLYIGKPSPEVAFDLRIMTPILLFSGYSCLLGFAGLVNIGAEKKMMWFVIIAGITNIISCVFLSNVLSDVGAAISITIAEFILCLMVLHCFIKNKRHNETSNYQINS